MAYTMSCGIGYCHLDRQTVPFINTAGSLQLTEVTCKNKVSIAGDLTARNCNFNIISVAGDALLEKSKVNECKGSGNIRLVGCDIQTIGAAGDLDLTDSSIVHGDVTHAGSVKIDRSSIEGTLESSSDKVKICNSHVKNILVKPVQNYSFFELFWSKKPSLQTVELSGKDCKVGSITFTKGIKGEVVLKDGARWNGVLLNGSLV